MARNARPARQREALLQAVRVIYIPLLQIAALILHPIAIGSWFRFERRPKPRPVTITEQLQRHAALLMLKPCFNAVEFQSEVLSRVKPVHDVCAGASQPRQRDPAAERALREHTV